jgi:hypothetical protein
MTPMGCTTDLGQGPLDCEDGSIPEQRRKFSLQFKAEAAQIVIETQEPSPRSPVIWRAQRPAGQPGHRVVAEPISW